MKIYNFFFQHLLLTLRPMLNNQSNNLKIIFLIINKFKLISMAKTVGPNVNVVKTKTKRKICIIFIDFF